MTKKSESNGLMTARDQSQAPARRLVVTADDFGLSLAVNEAVERAHRHGVLSAASLMVGAPFMQDAAARARKLEDLGVGLHLTLLNGRPVLPAGQVPGLVRRDGRFRSDAVRFGLALYASPELRRQAEAEIEAQFERFAETGLRLDHINGHRHFHLHPVVLSALLRLAPRFGTPPVRMPLEPFGPSYRANKDRAAGRLIGFLFYLTQSNRLRRQLAAAGIKTNDQIFGLFDSGAMVERRLLALIEQLPPGLTEIFCHPATQKFTGQDDPPSHYQPEAELAALLSETVKAKLGGLGIAPLSFRAAVAAAEHKRRGVEDQIEPIGA